MGPDSLANGTVSLDKTPNNSKMAENMDSSFTYFNYSHNTSTVRKKPLNQTTKTVGTARNGATRYAKIPMNPNGADSLISVRNAINFNLSHYLMNNDTTFDVNKKTTISETMGDLSKTPIIRYQQTSSPVLEGYSDNRKILHSSAKSTKKTSRYISSQPELILSAPDLIDDYYLQLIDWSSTNILAVALKSQVYLWNGATGNIDALLTLDEPDTISSLSWAKKGNFLAVGVSNGKTQLWDVSKSKRLRTLSNSSVRISSLSWNAHLVSNGSQDGNIYNHDVRIASSLQSTYTGHTQEICALKWSPSGRLLASGGNDTIVNIWSGSMGRCDQGGQSTMGSPVYTFSDHKAAVKALAWCPWQSNCLATGGGAADRMIRIWNSKNGQNLCTVNAHSQVSAIVWSREYRELVSSHGYLNNELIIWKYPTLSKVTQLIGHSARTLGMAMSPDGHTVVSLGADETLRFWECFQVDSETKKTKEKIQEVKFNNR